MQNPIHVAVTGAAGQIAYSLLFRIASGSMFGPDQPVVLHLLEISPALPALEGVVMELDDCAFPLVQGIVPTADVGEGFRGVNWALLVGSVPRKAGMERKDLLGINGKNFHRAGTSHRTKCGIRRARARGGKPVQHQLPDRHEQRERRAVGPLVCDDPAGREPRQGTTRGQGGRGGEGSYQPRHLGNHSATQFPDFTNAKIGGRPATEVIIDKAWLEGPFISTVQQRGAAIIKARGQSSAASAANAVVDTVRSLVTPTPQADWTSVAVCSPGDRYGIEAGLICSFPVRTDDGKGWSIVPNVPVSEFSQSKIDATVAELKEEKSLVAELIGGAA